MSIHLPCLSLSDLLFFPPYLSLTSPLLATMATRTLEPPRSRRFNVKVYNDNGALLAGEKHLFYQGASKLILYATMM